MGDVSRIEFELSGVRERLRAAIADRHSAICADFDRAVAEHCSSEALRELIAEKAREAVDRAVSDAVARYFAYGDGRAAVQSVVDAGLAGVTAGFGQDQQD